MWRRWSGALALSVLAHVALVAVVLGLGLGGGLGGRVDVEITGMRLDEIKDLPLGGPAGGGDRPGQTRHRARHRPPPAPAAGTLATPADDREQPGAAAPDSDENGPAPTGDLTAYGPKGSRFTALLRLDRLRGTEYAGPVDALLIATPHPLDPSVTFLAARHHLDEAALRTALGRGARATDRILSWHVEAGRPIGERRARHAADPGAPVTRDDRIIVLAAPGLAVVTPPAYRSMLLARPPAPAASDGGAAPDGGGPDAGAPAAEALGWAPLLSRIDAEEGLMPPDGVVMVSAVDIFKSGGAAGAGPRLVYGLEIPSAVSALVTLAEAPGLDLEGEFPTEEPALRWEAEWPTILSRLRAHPIVLLSGFSPLLSHATLTREGRKVHLHVTATRDETLRLLAFALHMLGG
jgi:hypothetical protein